MITKNINGDLRDVHALDNVLKSEAIKTSNEIIINRCGALGYEHMTVVQAFKEVVKHELSIVHDSKIEINSNEFECDGREIHSIDLVVTTKVKKSEYTKTHAGFNILGLTLERFDQVLKPKGYRMTSFNAGYYGHIRSQQVTISYHKEVI